jgi:hypothetical protein
MTIIGKTLRGLGAAKEAVDSCHAFCASSLGARPPPAPSNARWPTAPCKTVRLPGGHRRARSRMYTVQCSYQMCSRSVARRPSRGEGRRRPPRLTVPHLLVRRNPHATPGPAQTLAGMRRLAQHLASLVTVKRPCKSKIRPINSPAPGGGGIWM